MLLLGSVYLWPDSLLAWFLPVAVVLIANGFFDTSNRIAVVYSNPEQAGVANSAQIFFHLMSDSLCSAMVAMLYDSPQNVALLMVGVLLFSWVASGFLLPLFSNGRAAARKT